MTAPSLPTGIAALHAAYAAGLTPSALLQALSARHDALADPGIFLHRPAPADLDAAVAALPEFDPARYPLWGVPVAVKDNIDVAGMPTTAACPDFAHLPAGSAPAVARLVAAGALVIGKTNLDQFATGLVGTRTPHPIPRNACAPDRVPGGSSSGSAVAVAQGLALLALGTDTAGSGRVPAALNGLVGLKPSVGAITSRGVVPACPSLDCISVFANSVADAWAGFAVMAGADDRDPWSRPITLGTPGAPLTRLGIPRAADLHLDGAEQRAAWDASLARIAPHVTIDEIDLTPFLETARLLYEGAFVAERDAAFGHLVPRDAMHPVTQRILAGAARFTATDAFAGLHRLAALRLATLPAWARMEALLVPTAPNFPTLAELEADPIGSNARLGTYTNFVNLLDLAALAVPAMRRPDGLPFGITLIGPRASDAALAATGAQLMQVMA
ncbi:allophanate hydrolase [Falsiroseomonas sp.]|uniref:allophanate hydrolase n=1 Tax=Falsiroseomonas sp. TaxID=2870721 RepID=UPI00271A0C70|nr:allophanate hydrolase [Falsiroseomonas sp.]MDO9500855.1 allophanate hydrolase [Falsiroseomonas sp.]